MTTTTTVEKYPYKLFDDTGTAFTVGLIGGTLYHLIKGTVKPAAGNRFAGGILAVRSHAPRLASSFALWGGTYAAFEYLASSARGSKKHGAWDSVMAGAATGGVLRLRWGPRAAVVGAIGGGALFGVVNGVGIVINRVLSPPPSVVFDDPDMKSMVGGGVPSGSIRVDEHAEVDGRFEKVSKLERFLNLFGCLVY